MLSCTNTQPTCAVVSGWSKLEATECISSGHEKICMTRRGKRLPADELSHMNVKLSCVDEKIWKLAQLGSDKLLYKCCTNETQEALESHITL